MVCVNVLGGCQGSTGPASIDPATGAPYGSRFPVVTIRDMVRTQAAVADHLGIAQWLAVVGGSMGGMQALEWGIIYPHRTRAVVAIATTAAASAQQIAWSAIGRNAVILDPAWRGGDYYDAAPGDGPHRGLALARELAQITYRTGDVFDQKFGRGWVDPMDDRFTLWQRFDVEGYLDYHGAKLVRRFDANSYLVINRAMDLHDVGRGRGGIDAGAAPAGGPLPGHEHQLRHALPAVPATAPAGRAGRPGHPLPVPRHRQPRRPRRVPARDRPGGPTARRLPRRGGQAT